jgi:DnaJ-domain-containing protein 1
MQDFFAVMGEPRRPWLDPEALKAKFHELSAKAHPDHAHRGSDAQKKDAQEQFTLLNAAYNCLRQHRDRLQHLLELEFGTRPRQIEEVPPELTDLFMKVASVCRAADALIRRKPASDSPLLQLQHFESAQAQIGLLHEIQHELRSRVEAELEKCRQLDSEWTRNAQRATAQPDALKEELARLYGLLGYYNKWTGQAQERAIQLSF